MTPDDARRWRARVQATLEHAGRELDAMHAVPAGDLALAQDGLRELMEHGRRPRIAAIGRRGAAKSSLLNAIAGEPLAELGDVEDATRVVRWTAVGWGAGEVLYADTPGLRASGRSNRVADVARALAFAPPDVVLVLCHATEVDAGIDDDIADVQRLLEAIEGATGVTPPVAAVVTRVDELDPPDAMQPPYDNVEKQQNIARAMHVLRSHLSRGGIEPVCVVPVATYLRFENGEMRDDLRWNVERLVQEVLIHLPDPLGRADAAGRDVRRLLASLMDALTEVLARRVSRAGARGDDDEDARTRELLVRWSRGLAPYPSRAGAVLGTALRRAAPLGWARNVFTAVGATRWSATAAAARVRAIGKSLRGQLLEHVPLEDFAMLATVAGGP